jgi:hypothetical protein
VRHNSGRLLQKLEKMVALETDSFVFIGKL